MAAAFMLFGLLPSFLAIGYLLVFVVLRALQVCDQAVPSPAPTTRFAIVIPAYNEADCLSDTLRQGQSIDYPVELFQIFVVADNCTDATAEIARQSGACCLERHDPARGGKGHALAWALPQILDETFDAVVVLDADCHLDVTSLRRVDWFLREGHPVVQLNHRVLNPDESAISYAAAVGRTLEYDLFFAPKSRVGGAVLLVGTGMVFAARILSDHPWQAHTCAEDTEYTVQLTRAGVPVRFLSNAHIGCRSVTSAMDLNVQRKRWASGNLQLGRTQALRWIVQATLGGRWRLADLAWSLLLASRPLWLLHLALTLLSAGLAGILAHRGVIAPWPRPILYATVALPILYGVYFLSGIIWLGVTARRVLLLVQAPLVIARLIQIALRALFSPVETRWARTPR